MKKIIIRGKGGQGIKLLSHVLASILAELNKRVSLVYRYDADVRGSEITAFLVYSDKTIENPIFDEADILLKLSEEVNKYKAKKIIIEKDFCRERCESCMLNCKQAEVFPFQKVSAEKFGTQKFINMIALGKILKVIGIDLNEKKLQKQLPEEFIKENIEAVKYGFNYRDDI